MQKWSKRKKKRTNVKVEVVVVGGGPTWGEMEIDERLFAGNEIS